MSEREQSLKRRAEAREQRRRAAEAARRSDDQQPDKPETEHGFDVRSAARAAASAVALGATVGAGRALAERPHSDGDESDEAERPSTAADGDGADTFDAQLPEPGPRRRDVSGARPNQVKEMVARAREQLEGVQGRPVESVSGFERRPDGWLVELEVVELSRIPETTDVLATYEVLLDGHGGLMRYTRKRRYYRSEAGDEDHA